MTLDYSAAPTSATAYVLAHSPFRGATFTVHLALACTVDDSGDSLYRRSITATKDLARVSARQAKESIDALLENGYLEEVDGHHGRKGSRTFRFQFPTPVVHKAEGVRPRTLRSLATGTNDPNTAKAHPLTVLAFDQPRKPLVRGDERKSFVAVLGLIKQALAAGHSAAEIETAIRHFGSLDEGIVWTLAGLQFALSATPRSGEVSYETRPVQYR
ncbi:MAG: hypothetical protein JWM85_2330 [Acidimicrobiaceae bacterium]|nr:hypothetical protein [Acidimicrobiaceae bacterium]